MADYEIQQGNLTRPLYFLLILSSDHITGATGKTPTVTILKSGGASFATPAGAVSELANGVYQVAANALDASSLGPLLLHATASGCDPVDTGYEVVLDLSAAAIALSPGSTSATTITADDLITRALKMLGVIAGTETPAPDQAVDALDDLNDLLDSWRTERLTIPSTTRTLYSLSAGTASYTIGPSGTFNQAWPETITRAGLVYTSGSTSIEIPLSLLTVQGYANIPIKAQTSGFPQVVYYDHAYSNGLGNLTFWPVPDGTYPLQVALYYPAIIGTFASLNTAYAFPPGYARALRYALALELSVMYPRASGALVQQIAATAAESKANLKRANQVPIDLPLDPLALGRGSGIYNIVSDTNG